MSESTRVDVLVQSERYVVNAPVWKIEVPENRLRELRDFAGLAASMERLGLLQPIICTEAGVLVAGRHRLEAARSLGWDTIPSFVVQDDELENRLQEIDENLRRLDLTVYEQSKHAAERERILEAFGRRQGHGGDRRSTAHGEPLKTQDIAREANMSAASWKRRTKIGEALGTQTRAVLDHADPTDDKQRNLLNSTTQLDHLANISKKHGDEVAAQVAEHALSEDGGNTFKAYEEVKGNHRALGTGENEWYTPPDVMADVRSVLGEIDLDPASSEVAQRRVKAARYFSKEDGALEREWGGRVFLNPPYSQPAIGHFADKMVEECRAGRVSEAVMLTHNYTDTRWFHAAESEAAAICFTRGRIKFVSPNGELAAPTQGQAFFYYGNAPDTFREVFSKRGFVR